jgi:hypothetical protein
MACVIKNILQQQTINKYDDYVNIINSTKHKYYNIKSDPCTINILNNDKYHINYNDTCANCISYTMYIDSACNETYIHHLVNSTLFTVYQANKYLHTHVFRIYINNTILDDSIAGDGRITNDTISDLFNELLDCINVEILLYEPINNLKIDIAFHALYDTRILTTTFIDTECILTQLFSNYCNNFINTNRYAISIPSNKVLSVNLDNAIQSDVYKVNGKNVTGMYYYHYIVRNSIFTKHHNMVFLHNLNMSSKLKITKEHYEQCTTFFKSLCNTISTNEHMYKDYTHVVLMELFMDYFSIERVNYIYCDKKKCDRKLKNIYMCTRNNNVSISLYDLPLRMMVGSGHVMFAQVIRHLRKFSRNMHISDIDKYIHTFIDIVYKYINDNSNDHLIPQTKHEKYFITKMDMIINLIILTLDELFVMDDVIITFVLKNKKKTVKFINYNELCIEHILSPEFIIMYNNIISQCK